MMINQESCRGRKTMILWLFLAVLPFFSSFVLPCNQLERASLLIFMNNLSLPSASITTLNWSNSGPECCSWDGVSCDGGRVVRISLPSRGLVGTISPSILNLTSLSYLNLPHNRLSGPLPPRFFSSLRGLKVLDLSFNRLTGELPTSLVSNQVLETVDLSSNRFSGQISSSVFEELRTLVSFNVSNNTFTGNLPVSTICTANSSRFIRFLDFSYNDFNGYIPSGVGTCSRLEDFRAGFNNLSGTIPNDIYDATALRRLSLPVNHLSGVISDGILRLTNLVILELYSNQFSGSIPRNVGSLSKLEDLQLHINFLSGPLPSSLRNCSNITRLNLRVNYLKGRLSDFDFSAFTRLHTLDLGNNNFTGGLPESLFLCKSLAAVRLASNELEGQIPPGIVGLQSLSFLSLSMNRLKNITGAIRILMGCRNLGTLVLSTNFMHEAIPDDANIVDTNGFQNIQVLALGGCNLTGQVPAWFAKLKRLQVLDLSYNRLRGGVPGWFGNLQNLFYLDLSNNLISGEFPIELTSLPALVSTKANYTVDRSNLELPVFVRPNNATIQPYNQLSSLPRGLYLRSNGLSGNIPVEIGQLKSLVELDLSGNNFRGSIPAEICNLTELEKLDLSGNNLSGEIPASFRGLHFLSSFKVANNNLQGQIPTGGQFDTFPSSSFEGNPGLCGLILQRPCSDQPASSHPSAQTKSIDKKLLIGLVVGICFSTGIIVTILSLWILSKRRIIPCGDNDEVDLDTFSSYSNPDVSAGANKETTLVMLFPNSNGVGELSVGEIVEATNNFNQENIIGCGGFGLVYKATLADGTKLAIKKLSGELGLMEREFKAEVEALSSAQHENLVSLQGYCVYEGFRLLIYSYMENGSLDYWLHEREDGPSQLDWPIRLKIAQGASRGVAYMHQICEPHIVHRDIKSSNILLDEKFEAHVADFGLARLILPYRTHVTTEIVGTLGYIPPEYGQAWVATLRGDVYSFGVVMLELLTGRRPMEIFRPRMSAELVAWVQQMRSEGRQDEIFDLLLKGKGYDVEMLQVLDVACMCVNQDPFQRPTIQQVVDWLKNVGERHRQ